MNSYGSTRRKRYTDTTLTVSPSARAPRPVVSSSFSLSRTPPRSSDAAARITVSSASAEQGSSSLQRRSSSPPLLKNDEWKTHPEVLVRLRNLTSDITIKDIYLAVCQFGTPLQINLTIDSFGHKTGDGTIRFSQVVYPFWEKETMKVASTTVKVELRKSTTTVMIPSRINPTKLFFVKTTLEVDTLEFGFMIQPEEFMAMYTTKPGTKINWEVNLHKKTIQLSFTLKIEKSDADNILLATQPTVATTKTNFDRTENFMIQIPFTYLDFIFVPAGEDRLGSARTFVIPLPNPPKVYRELTDWTKSMEPELTRWNVIDAWMRQTDIQYNMANRRRPVSLRHQQPLIDIGKWTTYRLAFKPSVDQEKYNKMMDSFKDYNVPIKPLESLYVCYDVQKLNPIWTFMDGGVDGVTQNSLLLQNLDKPFLPFPVRYQLEACISYGYLNENNLTPEFINRLSHLSEHNAVSILEYAYDLKIRIFNPMELFDVPPSNRPDSYSPIPEYCVYMRRATVTPTGIHFHTPSTETSNRVIRHYHMYSDRFLRVSFTDEKQDRIRFTDRLTSNELFSRVFRTLEQGITMGDRHYQFLAFGNSQLREHGAYFFAPTDDLTPQDIRDWMGDFKDIRIIAKHASRLGQCFSTTRVFKSCKVDCVKIDDIERNGYRFSDGVGKMSPVVARLLTEEVMGPKRKYPVEYQASCFQFRLGGCKGVLAVDPNVPGLEVHIRPSQRKFWSRHAKLEIIRCSQYACAALNRQLIQVMTALGVDEICFTKRLAKMLKDYHMAVSVPSKAMELLTKHIDANQMTLVIANLVRGGFMQSQEPFLLSLLHLWRAWTIKYLKEKARIAIDQSAFLLGVMDETASLRGYEHNDGPNDLSQIFCQVSNPLTGEFKVITGPCIVARNPSLHVGDVRVVEAVDIPALHHLVDVVAFPQTGDRDIPNMLSGGDLDGDDYVVIWDQELTSQITNEPPASYKGPTVTKLDRDVSLKDIISFFVKYMKNDRLGSIANAHLAWSDKLSDGTRSNICSELAQLHSDAVDYPKTGVKAQMAKRHRVPEWPHFFEKPESEPQYHSNKILGILYDKVDRIDFTPSYDLEFNAQILNNFKLIEKELDEARMMKRDYDAALRRIMSQHDIKSEFEVWSTFVMHHSGNNDYKFHEEIGELSFVLKSRFRKMIIHSCENRSIELPRKVAAIYTVTAMDIETTKADIEKERDKNTPRGKGRRYKGFTKKELDRLPFMSFPWVFPELLVDLSVGRVTVMADYGAVDFADVTQIDDDMKESPIEGRFEDNDVAIVETGDSDDDVPVREVDGCGIGHQDEVCVKDAQVEGDGQKNRDRDDSLMAAKVAAVKDEGSFGGEYEDISFSIDDYLKDKSIDTFLRPGGK